INGAAITVGCELALACDFRIVGPKALFQESWIRLGIIPPLGGLFLLPHIVGLGMAKEMVLTGRAIDAQEALSSGLATSAVDDAAKLMARAQAYAEELSRLPPLAYRAAKEGIHRGLESSMEKEWSANVLSQTILLGSHDFREGLASVKEKRAPSFMGR
ncbi:MAG: enoyl-CoA hydratase-related protein, partial [Sphingomonas sp.]|nr:enoyl-CoA hydratase-related protein [Sphingomonas sp.]